MSKTHSEIILVIDSGCDLPLEYIKQDNIVPLGLICNFKGQAREDDFGEKFTRKDFYDALRQGETPTTSQINSQIYLDVFKKYVLLKKSIIYIALSSALTGTINSANIARETILEDFPDADIRIIDSKCASLGQGLLTYYAYEMLKSGKATGEIVKWLEENKLRINHWFTVNDLNHLKRGGRISSSAAAVGTLLNIKPVLFVDNEGRLIPFSKCRGRKKAISTLVQKFKEKSDPSIKQVIAISHGDCLGDALALELLLRENGNVKDVILNYVGTAVGSHVGPEMLGIFFIAKER
ncbi:DegV family protein [Clostridium estertheticum]|uniref:DegV family protein n=1 Tax=Clostridium estertheticum TaxID=238834 RepID=UPI001CF20A51|nr:DegV family protein [Clostridium estertheticum]MCB2307860.1 DegV family protein [Clostridium estertheticum]MCB2345468.1 DegV family protein [Clostridium estertheticum]MCB2350684.1 DegV family protein [Clostridium estertheticum]WAG47052.1 DegV family protein [Clostridium estertheticum]